MATATATNSREARMRKILERGSDRLAFITGQINDVPPPPYDSASLPHSHLRTDESLSETIPSRHQILTPQKIDFTSQEEIISDAMSLHNADHIIHQSRGEHLQNQNYAETLTESFASDPRDRTILQLPATTSSDETTSVVDMGASQAFTPLVCLLNTITSNHIGAAIDASEYARMFSALVIALLVILSHLRFSSLGNIVIKLHACSVASLDRCHNCVWTSSTDQQRRFFLSLKTRKLGGSNERAWNSGPSGQCFGESHDDEEVIGRSSYGF